MSNRLPISNTVEIKKRCERSIQERLVDFTLPCRATLTDHDSIILHSLDNSQAHSLNESRFALYGEQLTVGKIVDVLESLLSETGESAHPIVDILEIQTILGLQVCVFNGLLTENALQTIDKLRLDVVNFSDIVPNITQPGLIVMDMDSTTIEIECIDEIAKLHGVGKAVSEVTEQAMRGELDFSESLRARVSKLKGARETILANVKDTLPIMPGLEPMLKAFYDKGWHVAIASGGFTYFADYLKERFNLYRVYANELVIEQGQLTGEVSGQIVDAQFKANVLIEMANALGFELSQTVAIGDGANDLPMIKQAALGVAYQAKPSVQAQSKLKINHNDLRGLFVILAISSK